MVKLNAAFRRLSSLRGANWPQLLFFLPLILGVLAKLHRSKFWFGDYQAIACAGQKALAHAPIYTLDLQCPGMHPSVYVYIPVVARIAAAIEHAVTERGLFLLYLGLYLVSLGALAAIPYMRRFTPGAWRDKLPFAVFLSGSAVMWGNIAVILHAVVLAGALMLETAPWLFIAAVAIAAAVKPVFLTYLVVIVIADMPLRRKLMLGGSGIMAGLAPTLLFMLNEPETARQWQPILTHFVYQVTPGYGFYGWLDGLGVSTGTVYVQAAYVVFAGLLVVSGVVLSQGLKLDNRERIWLGLSLAGLLIPRIMSQDMFLLAPGLMILASKSAQLARPGDRDTGLIGHGPQALIALCSFALAGGLTTLGRYTLPMSLLGLSLYILYLGGRTLAPQAIGAVRTARNLLPSSGHKQRA